MCADRGTKYGHKGDRRRLCKKHRDEKREEWRRRRDAQATQRQDTDGGSERDDDRKEAPKAIKQERRSAAHVNGAIQGAQAGVKDQKRGTSDRPGPKTGQTSSSSSGSLGGDPIPEWPQWIRDLISTVRWVGDDRLSIRDLIMELTSWHKDQANGIWCPFRDRNALWLKPLLTKDGRGSDYVLPGVAFALVATYLELPQVPSVVRLATWVSRHPLKAALPSTAPSPPVRKAATPPPAAAPGPPPPSRGDGRKRRRQQQDDDESTDAGPKPKRPRLKSAPVADQEDPSQQQQQQQQQHAATSQRGAAGPKKDKATVEDKATVQGTKRKAPATTTSPVEPGAGPHQDGPGPALKRSRQKPPESARASAPPGSAPAGARGPASAPPGSAPAGARGPASAPPGPAPDAGGPGLAQGAQQGGQQGTLDKVHLAASVLAAAKPGLTDDGFARLSAGFADSTRALIARILQ